MLFLPDQHLGRNTAVRELGLSLDDCVVYNPLEPNGGLTVRQLRQARMILWRGHCSVHGRFTTAQVARVRERVPGVRVLVHPECTYEVVSAADLVGSTEYIIRTIEAAPAGSAWAIGTELNLVRRLAEAHPDKTITFLESTVCYCATMNRIDLPHLVHTLESLVRGEVINQITVEPAVAADARLALDRMLALPAPAAVATACRIPHPPTNIPTAHTPPAHSHQTTRTWTTRTPATRADHPNRKPDREPVAPQGSLRRDRDRSADHAGARDRLASARAPKGRPTPKRRTNSVPPPPAPRTRKEAAAWQKQQGSKAKVAGQKKLNSTEYREAMKSGDPRVLPRREQGPVRALARDYVDSHRMASNYLLLLFPLMFVGYTLRPLQYVTLLLFALLLLEWMYTGSRIRKLARSRGAGRSGVRGRSRLLRR